MSVETLYMPIKVLTNGTVKEFGFSWSLTQSQDIKCYYENSRGVKTLIDSSLYSLQRLGNNAGGIIIFTNAPIAGQTLLIERIEESTQEKNFTNVETFNLKSFNDALDKLTRWCQEQDYKIGQSIKIPETASSDNNDPINIWNRIVLSDTGESIKYAKIETGNLYVKSETGSWIMMPNSNNVRQIRQKVEYINTTPVYIFQYSLNGIDWFSVDTTGVQLDLQSEISARIAADTILQNNINSETSARVSADITLQENIDAEAITRASNDTTLDNKIDAVANAGLASVFYTYGLTGETVFVIPYPENITDTYFDFTTKTPYTAESDLSGWVAGTPVVITTPVKYAITGAFWDLLVGSDNAGTAIYSPSLNEWGYFPDKVGGGDNITIIKNNDGTLSVKNLGISTAKIADLAVSNDKIATETITDSKISTSASIQQSKIFGLADEFNKKLDKKQSVSYAGKFLSIDGNGNITFVDSPITNIQGSLPLGSVFLSDNILDEDETGFLLQGSTINSTNHNTLWTKLLADFNSGSSETDTIVMAQGSLDATPNVSISFTRGLSGRKYIATTDTVNITKADAQISSGNDSPYYRIDTSALTCILPIFNSFPRFTNNSTNVNDFNQDQIVDINGSIGGLGFVTQSGTVSGALSVNKKIKGRAPTTTNDVNGLDEIVLTSSKDVRTGSQVQPKNTSFLLYFKVKEVAADSNIYVGSTIVGNGSQYTPLDVADGAIDADKLADIIDLGIME